MDFQVGDENPLTPNIEDHATALTQLESSAQEIHKSLNSILDYQTHHRLVSDRCFNEALYFTKHTSIFILFCLNEMVSFCVF